jgi:hypothetical protein
MTEAVSELFALAQDCNDVCLYDAVKLYVVAFASGQLGDFNRRRAPLLTTYMHFSIQMWRFCRSLVSGTQPRSGVSDFRP